MAPNHMNRRGFLARLPGLPAASAGLASAAASGCAGVPYVTGQPVPEGVRVPISAFGDGADGVVEAGGQAPLYVRRRASGGYTAVLLRCTHRGCQPDPETDRLTCPCHGSEFGFDGRVLQGPAEDPLPAFTVRDEGDSLLIVGREPERASRRTSGPFRSLLLAGLTIGILPMAAVAQADSTAVADTTIAQGGLYNRPFVGSIASTSIGGYLEGNSNYFVDEGVTDGLSFELRRFNIFLFSSISPRIRFLAELEFEHGTEEIALETAQVDLQISPALTFRAGIVLPPLGYLNENHDSPRWDFVERPFATTDIIPSTLSDVGAGVLGRFRTGPWTLSYNAYVTNGLQEGVTDNALGRTDIASGKADEVFGEDNNGSPALSGRVAARHARLGELGASYYGGHYNRFRLEGEEVEERRWLRIAALDARTSLGPVDLTSEMAFASIGVPAGLAELFGDSQWGGYLDAVATVWTPRLRGFPDAEVRAGFRVEHIDYNRGTFASTGRDIRDDVTAWTPMVSFRPTPGTVLRVNYRRHWTRDFVGNETSRLGGLQVGFATYF